MTRSGTSLLAIGLAASLALNGYALWRLGQVESNIASELEYELSAVQAEHRAAVSDLEHQIATIERSTGPSFGRTSSEKLAQDSDSISAELDHLRMQLDRLRNETERKFGSVCIISNGDLCV